MEITLHEDERFDEINEDLKIIQKKNGLTFGSDTYLLSAFITPQRNGRAADLGSGTGIASLLCASKEKFKKIYSVELQESFCELISRNAALNRLDGVIAPIHADVRDVTADLVGGELDAVFSNPPYMKADSGKRNIHDEKYIARHEVFGGIDDFCAAASRLLKFGGIFYCVYRPDRLSDLMAAMRKHDLEPKVMVFVSSDAKTEPSSVIVRAKKGAAPSVRICRPLFLHTEQNVDGSARPLSSDARVVYDTFSFDTFLKS